MHILRVLLLVSLASVLATPAEAQSTKNKKAVDFTAGPGIKIGKELPEIKLMNQAGEETSVHKILESGNVALVFFRSADW